MTRLEHYREAERLLDEALSVSQASPAELALLARAQVHATMAGSGIPDSMIVRSK